MPHASPDETHEKIASLHQGIVVELHRRLSDVGAERGAPFGDGQADELPSRDGRNLSRSIEHALTKITAMQAFIRAQEETIFERRQAEAAHETQQLESRRLLQNSERRCREESERAGRAERLIELLEQRNAQLETDFTELSRKIEDLLRAIHLS